jgi:hypothetical protein
MFDVTGASFELQSDTFGDLVAEIDALPILWSRSGNGRRWRYRFGATTAQSIKIVDRPRLPNELRINLVDRRAPGLLAFGDAPPLARMVFGDETAALGGLCGERVFAPEDCKTREVATRFGLGIKMVCKSR